MELKMFSEVIEISYFCRIPCGGLGFDDLCSKQILPYPEGRPLPRLEERETWGTQHPAFAR